MKNHALELQLSIYFYLSNNFFLSHIHHTTKITKIIIPNNILNNLLSKYVCIKKGIEICYVLIFDLPYANILIVDEKSYMQKK